MGYRGGALRYARPCARVGIRQSDLASPLISARRIFVFQRPRFCTAQQGRLAVAKGQMRSNREKKKPKQDKAKAGPTSGGFASASSNPAASAYANKKK